VRIAGAIQDVETWDPTTGASRPAEVVAVDDDGTEVRVRFDEAPLAVLVWRDGEPRQAEARTDETRGDPEIRWHELPLDGPWTASVVPTIDNRFGDLALPASTAPFPVQQWRLRHRVETDPDQPHAEASWADPEVDDAGWDEVLVGNGTFAWLAGPAPAAELEEPEVWEPVRFSLSQGIERDPVHVWTRGTSGRVPDEFWRVESVAAGDTVVLRTSLQVDTEQQVTLAVAANGDKQVRWNGELLGEDPGGFLRLDPVQVKAGHNLLQVWVTAEVPETATPPMYQVPPLRGYWALVTDPVAFRRPAWIRPADEGQRGTQLVATRTLTLPGAPCEGRIQLGTEGPARLVVNGEEVAIQGAFDPYGRFRVLPHDLAEHLHEGDNTLEVVLTDVGNPQAVFADIRVETSDGRTTSVVSDTSWTFTRNGAPVATALRRDHPFDAQWATLTPRPHPLPRARWLHPDHLARDHEGVVLDVVPAANDDMARPAEWFRTLVPPGATSATLPLSVGTVRIWLDGVELTSDDGEVDLPDPDRERRVLTVRIRPEDGRTEGALWDGPIEFRCGTGRLSPGDWADAGLGSYSGAVSYRRQIELDPDSRRVELDLGIVRGTAEVHLNGEHAGTRIWSPYRFDLTDLVRPGTNDLEVSVRNTLAPYLGDASPTPHVYPGHRTSGPLGPIRLLTADADVTGARAEGA
jgi:hypothetical protein